MRLSPIVIGLAAGGIAYASIPETNGVVHGCYKTLGGALRVIDTGKKQACVRGELALSWNQTGPKGTTGTNGPTGAKGPTGTTGATGPSDAWMAQGSTPLSSTGYTTVASLIVADDGNYRSLCLVLRTGQSASTICKLLVAGNELGATTVSTTGGGSGVNYASFALLGATTITAAPATASVECTTGTSGTNAGATLIATKVGTLLRTGDGSGAGVGCRSPPS